MVFILINYGLKINNLMPLIDFLILFLHFTQVGLCVCFYSLNKKLFTAEIDDVVLDVIYLLTKLRQS